MAADLSQDIRDRTFTLACDVARLGLRMSTAPGARRIVDQLVRAGTSVSANLEEAKAASTRKDFVYCVQVSLREARETSYWLRVCRAVKLAPPDSLSALLDESDQIARILGIVVSTKRRMATGQ